MDTRQGGYGYTECFKAEGVDLPSGYYFGMSAATSNLADDHDVLSFETYQVHPPARVTDVKKEEKCAREVEGEGRSGVGWGGMG